MDEDLVQPAKCTGLCYNLIFCSLKHFHCLWSTPLYILTLDIINLLLSFGYEQWINTGNVPSLIWNLWFSGLCCNTLSRFKILLSNYNRITYSLKMKYPLHTLNLKLNFDCLKSTLSLSHHCILHTKKAKMYTQVKKKVK